MKYTITVAVIVGAASLSGCASFSQAYAAQEASTTVGMHVAQKNIIKTLTDAICAVPYGDVIANPSFQPTAKAACLPSGGANSPDSLLPLIPTTVMK
jgi:hypothetical protein